MTVRIVVLEERLGTTLRGTVVRHDEFGSWQKAWAVAKRDYCIERECPSVVVNHAGRVIQHWGRIGSHNLNTDCRCYEIADARWEGRS